ncbi:flavin reductase family protein [Streptomyces platensis]|uniref:flavin reductase family protein n=1 Tax=Streptomyces platensis TaxID=58346 RepID=UPI00399D69CB
MRRGRLGVSRCWTSLAWAHVTRAATTTPTTPGIAGTPLLDGAIARFPCRSVQRLDAGDHIVFLGEVEQYEADGGTPLVFHSEVPGALIRLGQEASRYDRRGGVAPSVTNTRSPPPVSRSRLRATTRQEAPTPRATFWGAAPGSTAIRAQRRSAVGRAVELFLACRGRMPAEAEEPGCGESTRTAAPARFPHCRETGVSKQPQSFTSTPPVNGLCLMVELF